MKQELHLEEILKVESRLSPMVSEISPPSIPRLSYATRNDLISLAKALRDELREGMETHWVTRSEAEENHRKSAEELQSALTQIRNQLDTLVSSKVDSVQQAISSHLGKSLSSSAETQIKSLENQAKSIETGVFAKVMEIGRTLEKETDIHVKAMGEVIRSTLEDSYSKRLEMLENSYAKKLKTLENQYQDKISFLQSTYEAGFKQVASLLENLSIVSTPQINLPAPIVNVTVPEQLAPIINVPPFVINNQMPDQLPAEVIVNLPEQLAPIVNVAPSIINVPEQAAPVVNVEQPKARKVTKSITYDQHGRPETIIEEDNQ